jgi:enamine deaminase RidA (YjgF/YER057c/UK114 family)
MGKIERKLEEMGLALPAAAAPVANYVPVRRVGDLVYCSGQLPMKDGVLMRKGRLGERLTVEEGYACARQCALNALAAIGAAAGGLDRVAEVVQVRGYVACTPDFEQQPEVINGASDLLVKLFGEAGRHARAAVGVASLPRNAPVEVEMVVRSLPNG